MGCLAGPARCLLVIINIVFLLVGLAIAACGFVLRFGSSLYEPFIKVAKDELQQALQGTTLASFDVNSIDIGEMVQSLAIGLIVGGLILVALSFLGCCGACCKIESILWLYVIVIGVFVVGEIVAIGILYGKPDIIKDKLKDSLSDYKGLASSEVFSLSWNLVMIEFDCCGVDSYKDFGNATKWDTNPKGQGPLVTPLACCKDLPKQLSGFTCAMAPVNPTLNDGNTGCFQTLWDKSFANKPIVIPVLIVCGIIQFLFIIFAVVVIKDNSKVSPV